MKNQVVLRANAVPIYQFLSYMNSNPVPVSSGGKPKILDCGAGGPVPPLALFHQHGFDTWGIDVSEEQLARAESYCNEHRIDIHLQHGDMRQLPFEDDTFDAVYEHYSMCHLGKADTALAVGEMKRVLKPGGSCFLGFISTNTWPLSMFGQERLPGEYWGEEAGEDAVLHSAFTEHEADKLLSNWEIVQNEEHVQFLRSYAANCSIEDWMGLYDEAGYGGSIEQWQDNYGNRVNSFRYSHLFYILKKPAKHS